MLHCITRLLEALLRLLRAAGEPDVIPLSPPNRSPEHDEQSGPPQPADRTLWIAMYGIDIGPCSARGAEEAA